MWATIWSTWRRMPAIDSCAVIDRALAGARAARRLLGDLRHALRALGDLARGRQQLADGRGDLVHRGRLLLGAGRLLVGGRLQLGRRALDMSDGGADLLARASWS